VSRRKEKRAARQTPALPEVGEQQRNGKPGRYAKDPLRMLVLLAAVSTSLYLAISLLSLQFSFGSTTTQRPIVLVLTLFAAAFIVYLWSVRVAVQARQDRRLLCLIFVAAIAFRLILLPSSPIQEVDIYRYLWDGTASTNGVSPFRYSPEQVRTASLATDDEDLRKLVGQRESNPALATILDRVHFAELPTVYPPTSQFVFAVATFTTPIDAPVSWRLVVMKSWFVAFDLATLVLVVRLLRLAKKPIGLCLIYGWCPLLMKEVANSGHLDAVAVFFTTLAVYLAARLIVLRGRFGQQSAAKIWLSAVAVSVILALAVGAKIYPIVLAPLVIFLFLRQLGWKVAVGSGAALAAATLLVPCPMLPDVGQHEPSSSQRTADASTAPAPAALAAAAPAAAVHHENDASRGLTTFLRYWEMNDFIFVVVVENLKPAADVQPDYKPWFSIVPQSLRAKLIETVADRLDIEQREVPFVVTRAATTLAFLLLAGARAWRASKSQQVDDWLRAASLTLAWFWLLCPTQNPWYWTWALPLLVFARNRAWILLSGLVFLYYLRFWLGYHWPDTPVLGTGYHGHAFFDFVVTWIEFAPWFVLLAAEHFHSRQSPTRLFQTKAEPLQQASLRRV